MTHWHCLLWFTTAACVSAIATAATHDSAATATHDVSKACIHVDETAPPCANDATLFAFVGSAKGSKFVQKDNCATCVCGRDGEDEWRRLNNASRAAAANPEPSSRYTSQPPSGQDRSVGISVPK